MKNKPLELEVLPQTLCVCKLSSNENIPAWALTANFYSISKTSEELSIVCEQSSVPEKIKCERKWRCFKVKGPLDFGLTGILASIAKPLAENSISIFSISTFDTDYVLVKKDTLNLAIQVLIKSGIKVL